MIEAGTLYVRRTEPSIEADGGSCERVRPDGDVHRREPMARLAEVAARGGGFARPKTGGGGQRFR